VSQGEGGGRPTKYRASYCKTAKQLSKLGATEREIAEFLEIDETTLHEWKHRYPKFSQSIKLGKGPSDKRTEHSLFRRANGYTFDAEEIYLIDEVIETPAPTKKDPKAVIITRTKKVLRVPTVKHVPPDPTSMIFWLKNRRKHKWRDFKATELSTPPGRPLQTETYVAGAGQLLQDYYAKIAGAAAAADTDSPAPRDLGPDGSGWEEPEFDPDAGPR
jgi:hypothetical protein